MRVAFFYLTVLAVLISCKKDKLDIGSFWECNKLQNLDSTAIAGKLIGAWTWSKQACYWTGETNPADKNIKVTFKSDQTFSINENATILTQGTWKIMQVDGSSWGVDLSAPSEYLYGRILFCGNQVLFNDSYRDNCDHLFNKSN